MKKIREQADFDAGQQAASELHTFDRKGAPQEFSDRGRADLKVRANDPRFADNAMQDDSQLLDEFAGEDSKIDRLHTMLSRAGISDQQIRGGVSLTQAGLNKVAGKLAIGPSEVKAYINSLVQRLRNADENSLETLKEQYYNAVNVIDEDDDDDGMDEAGQSTSPFDQSGQSTGQPASNTSRPASSQSTGTGTPAPQPASQPGGQERYSYEPDALGSVTVRDAATGRSKFVQGAQATDLLTRLGAQGANRQAIIAPLVEKALPDTKGGFASEISAKAGTYNFQWRLGARNGLGTVMFDAEDGPQMTLVDVRDNEGNEIDVNPAMHRALMQQARTFLGNE